MAEHASSPEEPADRTDARDRGEDTPRNADGGGHEGAAEGGQDAADEGGHDGAAETTLDPWGSATVADYRNLFEEFGIEAFQDVLADVPNPHALMRRGVIFGHREYEPIAQAMREDEPFAALSGFMPTGDPHIGHKLVFDELIWHQQQGGDAYALIADLEAHSAREMDWAAIDEHTRDYLLSLLALGFDPEAGTLYRQSENRELQDLAFELGCEANFSELQAIYDFGGETDVAHMQSVVTQMADILYPQASDEPKPTVIPVGPDQDPHVRLARDLAARMRLFKVSEAYASFEADGAERSLLADAHAALSEGADHSNEDDSEPVRCADAAAWLESERPGEPAVRQSAVEKLDAAGTEPLRPRVRFFARRANEDAFEALIEAIDGAKRVYDGHVDAFDMDREPAEALARDIEVDHGGYGFLPPSSIYHRFMTGLTGGKMSSSDPASHISLLDDPEDGYDKVRAATTGGRETAEKQRELGGEADECPVYELYAYLLAGDEDTFATEVYEECVTGERLCGGCKEQAAELMREFLEDHQAKRAEAEELLEELGIELDVAGGG